MLPLSNLSAFPYKSFKEADVFWKESAKDIDNFIAH